ASTCLVPAGGPAWPAAPQAPAAQDTAVRALVPAGTGACCAVQVDPFHASASTVAVRAFDPTAVQALAEMQETAARLALPSGLGVGWIFHDDPFHASASVCLAKVGGCM